VLKFSLCIGIIACSIILNIIVLCSVLSTCCQCIGVLVLVEFTQHYTMGKSKRENNWDGEIIRTSASDSSGRGKRRSHTLVGSSELIRTPVNLETQLGYELNTVSSPQRTDEHSYRHLVEPTIPMRNEDTGTEMKAAIEDMTAAVRSLVGAFQPTTPAIRNTLHNDDEMERRRKPARHYHEESDSSEQSDNDDEWGLYQNTRRHRSSGATIPAFTGREKWKVWFNRFTAVANRKHWTENERLDELLPRLQGAAGDFVFGQLPQRVLTSYRYIVHELESRYRIVETPRTFAIQFSRRNQMEGECVEKYAAELKCLYDKAHPKRSYSTRREDLLRRFLDGLQDDNTRFMVEFIKDPADIDEAVYHVVNFMETKLHPAYYDEQRQPIRRVNDPETSEDDATVESDSTYSTEGNLPIMQHILERLQHLENRTEQSHMRTPIANGSVCGQTSRDEYVNRQISRDNEVDDAYICRPVSTQYFEPQVEHGYSNSLNYHGLSHQTNWQPRM
jgi:hypothetical protein